MTATVVIGTREKVYSHSRLSLFDEWCERAFFHKYVELRPDPSGLPAKIGKIFHNAMNKLLSEGYSPEEAVFFSIYEHDGLPEGEKEIFLIAMVNRAYKRIQQHTDDYSDVLSELHLVVDIGNGRKLQGYLDIVVDNPVIDEVSINDFKTSWQPYSAENSKQLDLYAWMYEKMRGGIVGSSFKGKLIFPRYDESTDSEVIFTREKMDKAYNWAISVIEEIESRDPSNINDWAMTTDRSKCENCSRSTLCSGGFMEGLPGDGNPKDEEEAGKIGDFILMHEIAIKRMKEGLKQFVKDKGAVHIRGGKWDFVQSEPSPSVPIPVLQQYAEDHGLNPADVLSSEKKTLKKWIVEDSTGFLRAQATWTTPRNSFKFVEDEKS
ncbi:PD-(D/E)XK nuclease family protein [Paenibacillus aestuarii]|uniref:PD-(D/E)XK nuclease family protein n=1 Tax=Paenibacillus aestuarii TaxID=516965 RepID=A0ABW0K9C3_9BACL